MRRKPLWKEITPQEMLYMREHEFLSNKQIAYKLQCSYQTVLKYIGPERQHRPRKKKEGDSDQSAHNHWKSGT